MMPNMSKMIKEAQKMQARVAEAQEKLGSQVVTGKAGGGLVSIQLNGKGEPVSQGLKIDASLANPEEVDVLEDLIMAALMDAHSKVQELTAQGMQEAMGNLKLPAGMNLPF